jgi:two-component system nitrogen regulation response regulator GlnG
MPNLLLIDNDSKFSERLAAALQPQYQVTRLEEAALEPLVAGEFAVVLLDNHMPKMNGLEFLRRIKERGVSVPVILITGYGDPDTIIEAIRQGAFGYVEKNSIDAMMQELKPKLARALEIYGQAEAPVPIPTDESEGADGAMSRRPVAKLIGGCPAMQRVYEQIGRVAESDQPVLILGEVGTGKDLVARAIHDNGSRRGRPFVVVRCRTFDDDMLRDELFGHEVGFRGEGKLLKGKIEYASGGTLFLDDVNALSPALQDEVLRVFEERAVTRLGDNEPISVDVRVLAASRTDLRDPTAKFRRELLDELASETICLPPLRERSADHLKALARYLLREEAVRAGIKGRMPELAADCWPLFRKHSWPRNGRELQVVLRKAIGARRGSKIFARDLSFEEPNAEPQILAGLHLAITSALSSNKSELYDFFLGTLRKELVELTLQACNGDSHEAERILGVSLDHIRNPDHARPESAGEKPPPKPIERRLRALVLIHTYPNWTHQQYADEVGCSLATMYRDKLIKAALNARINDPRYLSAGGYRTAGGGLEAIDHRNGSID